MYLKKCSVPSQKYFVSIVCMVEHFKLVNNCLMFEDFLLTVMSIINIFYILSLKLHLAADIIQKLYLIAHELPYGDQ